MDQVALPYRIVLLALLAVAALWFTVLKPKDPAPEAAATAPGVSGLANSVDKARGAADKAGTSAAAKDKAVDANGTGETPGSGSKAGTGSQRAGSGSHAGSGSQQAGSGSQSRSGSQQAGSGSQSRSGTQQAGSGSRSGAGAENGATSRTKAKSDAAAVTAGADRSQPLLRALDRGRVVVLLFFNPAGSDDRAARKALRGLDRRGGRVVARAARIGDVGRYAAITQGVRVLEAPTILVIDANRLATPIVGFTTAQELRQTVADAVRAGR